MKRQAVSMTHLMGRVFNTPLMIYRPKLDAIMHVIGPRLGVRDDMYMDVDDEMLVMERREEPQKLDGPVAVIPVCGSLIKRGDWMNSMSGLTSYDSLRSSVSAAMADSQVKTLLFDIDSPGGEAAGLFDFAAWLNSIRGEKQIIGIANDMAFSAAYAIASCMDKLYVTSVGGVGSIGVYCLHVDQSGWDKQNGVAFTYVSAGEKKVAGNPHEPLSKDAKAQMQAKVDKIRDMFVSLVAANRKVDAQKIYDTEAALYMGEDGVPLLADAVGCFDEAAEYCLETAVAKRSVAMPAEKIEGKILYKTWATSREHALQSLRGTSGLKPGVALKLGEDVYIANEEKNDDVFMAMRNSGSLRLNAGDAPGNRISGILAPYGKLSCDLGGFREMYETGCFKKSIEDGDPLILAYHDPSKVLGRKSAGTAKFWEEADGLHYEASLPDTQDARDLKTSIERGDVRGASAAFFIERYRWETRGGDRVRVVEQAELVEGSPHSFTAYDDTTADAEQTAVAAQDELVGVRLRLLKSK